MFILVNNIRIQQEYIHFHQAACTTTQIQVNKLCVCNYCNRIPLHLQTREKFIKI